MSGVRILLFSLTRTKFWCINYKYRHVYHMQSEYVIEFGKNPINWGVAWNICHSVKNSKNYCSAQTIFFTVKWYIFQVFYSYWLFSNWQVRIHIFGKFSANQNHAHISWDWIFIVNISIRFFSFLECLLFHQ